MLGGKLHAFLLLPLIAKPHTHHIFLKVELFGNGCYFLTGRSWLNSKVSFKRSLIQDKVKFISFDWYFLKLNLIYLFRTGYRCPFSWKKTRYRSLIIKLQLNKLKSIKTTQKHWYIYTKIPHMKLTGKIKRYLKIIIPSLQITRATTCTKKSLYGKNYVKTSPTSSFLLLAAR